MYVTIKVPSIDRQAKDAGARVATAVQFHAHSSDLELATVTIKIVVPSQVSADGEIEVARQKLVEFADGLAKAARQYPNLPI